MLLCSSAAGEAVLSQGNCFFKSLASNYACLMQDLALGTQPEGKEGSLLFFGRTLIKTVLGLPCGLPIRLAMASRAVLWYPIPSPCHGPSGESSAPGRHLIWTTGSASAFSHHFPAEATRAAPAQRLRAPHLWVPPAQGSTLSAWPPGLAIPKFEFISSVVSHPNNGVSF